MATTFIDYTGDGNATKSFSFPSIQESDVKVDVDGVIKSSGTHYNITSYTTTGGGNVVFTSGNIPASPADIRIFRETDVDSAKATYTAGASVKAADLNDNHEQLLFGIQEEQNQTIQTHEIKDSAVTTAKIKDLNVTRAKIANDAIDSTKLADNAVNSEHYVDGSIDHVHLANDVIDGDNIQDDVINSEHYVAGSIDHEHLANDIIDGDNIQDDVINSEHYVAGSIDAEHLSNNSVTTDKITNLNVTRDKIANDAINGDKIADNVIGSEHYAPNSIGTTPLIDGSVTTAKIADANVTTAKIANSNITTNKIADDNVVAGKLATDSVTTLKILDANVTTPKLADLSVTTAKIASDNVTTGKLATSAVTTQKIADHNVTTAKIADNAVNMDKIADATIVTSSEQASHTADNNTFFTTAAAEAAFLRQDSSETIASGVTWSSNDSKVATTAAIDLRIIELVDDVGGFVPIANETSFPTTNPDINTSGSAKGGTIVSVKTASTDLVPSSGTVTIANGRGSGLAVILTGVPSTIPSGFGFLVETTATDHTYAFHRLLPKATEVTTVATNIANVVLAGQNVTDINNFADLYQISTSAPTARADSSSLQVGDLWFDSSSNKVLMIYDGSSGDGFSAATPNQSDLVNINIVAGQITFQEDLGLITNAVSTGTGNNSVNTVAGSISNVNTVAGSISNVNAVAADNADIGAVAGKATEIGRLGTADAVSDMNTLGTSSNVTNMNTLAGISSNITTVAGISGNVTTVAGISSNVTTVAGNTSNINTVAGNNSNVTAVAGKATEIGRLGTAAAVADLAILGTTDVVADMNTLATTANVTAMDNCSDDIANINTVSGSIANVNTTAGAISNVNTTATNIANVNTVAGISSNVTAVAGNNSNVTTVAGSISNVNTVAGSITNVNTFANRYRIASSAPTSSLDVGDLYFDTTNNELRVYNGSSWQGGVTATGNLLLKTGGQMSGNITFSGSQTVDGRDLSVDGAKLDGIEASATADQTASEIVALISGQTIAPNVITTTNLTVDFGSIA